jgi:hypothetical protein
MTNHRRILPYDEDVTIVLDHPSLEIVEHQARMRKFWKAPQRNEFEQDDLDHLKACFPWIGDKTSMEFKEFQ